MIRVKNKLNIPRKLRADNKTYILQAKGSVVVNRVEEQFFNPKYFEIEPYEIEKKGKIAMNREKNKEVDINGSE